MMNLDVDLDGVTADGVGALVPWLAARGIRLNANDINHHDFYVAPNYHLGIAFDDAYKDPKVVESIKPIVGARWALYQLSSSCTIEMVTARPTFCRASTEKWVQEKLGTFPVHFEQDKSNGNGDVLVDDNLKHIEQVLAAGRIGIVFEQRWNLGKGPTNNPRCFRAKSWLDVILIVDALNTLVQFNGGVF